MNRPQDIEGTIRKYLLDEFLPGEDPANLTNSTPLMTAGILDSIATLKLVGFLEQSFGIGIAAHETGAEHLNTVESIARLVRSKSPAR